MKGMRSPLRAALTVAVVALLSTPLPVHATALPTVTGIDTTAVSAPAKVKKTVIIRSVGTTTNLKPSQKASVRLTTPLAAGERSSFKIVKNTAGADVFAARLPNGTDVLLLTPHGSGTVVAEYYVGTGRYNTPVRSIGTVTVNW